MVVWSKEGGQWPSIVLGIAIVIPLLPGLKATFTANRDAQRLDSPRLSGMSPMWKRERTIKWRLCRANRRLRPK
jgi:hypothetical protein